MTDYYRYDRHFTEGIRMTSKHENAVSFVVQVMQMKMMRGYFY